MNHKQKIFRSMHKRQKSVWLSFGIVILAVVATAFVATNGPSSKSSLAAPFTSCDVNGYLYKYPSGPTQIHQVDMVTGEDSQVGSISGRQINAVGYNPKDNFIYGWDDQNDVFVRVHSDHSTVDELTISGYTGPSSGIIIGDVDNNGHYWMLSGNTWYQIDLTTSTPTQIATGTPGSNPTGTAGADWAFVPGTDSLYRTMNNNDGTPGTASVWSFSRTTKTWTDNGVVSGIADGAGAGDDDRVIGANYADPDNHLYASSNETGNVWRIDLDSSPLTAVNIGQGNPSSSNDGARCALVSVPVDFGDAPSSYGTLLEDDGPRHNITGYISHTDKAPLMLSRYVDIETDGFPGSLADGDDTNGIDDEKGVRHIVVTPNTPTALSIPVTATNDTSSVATIAGWIDLDSDGTFETGERVTASVPANSGTAVYELNFPTATFTANSYSRFRIFPGTVSDPQPTGAVTGGEVEDVLVQVGSYSVNKSADPAEGTTIKSGETVTYTLSIQNTGSTDLTNLKIDDDLTDVLDDAALEGAPTVSPSSAGSASVDGDTLEFTGDIATGQTVTVSYTVKVAFLGSLSNSSLGNTILANHSNCHPTVSDGTANTDEPECNTSHPVLGLAATGMSLPAVLGVAGGLVGLSAVALLWLRRSRPAKTQDA